MSKDSRRCLAIDCACKNFVADYADNRPMYCWEKVCQHSVELHGVSAKEVITE